jgi:hypothetical protein
MPPNITNPCGGNNYFSMNQSHAAFSSQLSPLGTKPATTNIQYTCQAPKRKSSVTILLLVLVADWALLQAAWAIWNWILCRWLLHDDDKKMYCEGCLHRPKKGDGDLESQYVDKIDQKAGSLNNAEPGHDENDAEPERMEKMQNRKTGINKYD